MSEQDPIDQLAEGFLRLYRRGQRPSLTEYAEKHPELAPDIRELFPALVVMERLGPQPEDLRNATEPAAYDHKIPEQLGEYRILREVGRGGMGIVYEAEQVSLGRHVALKVLPLHAVMDPHHLSRFQQEARAAARLHHTNIVPVFGVGEEQGIHYYAMQFIHGQGLDQVLDEVRRLRVAETTSGESRESGVCQQADPFASQVARGLISGQSHAEPACPDAEHAADQAQAQEPEAQARDAAEGPLAGAGAPGPGSCSGANEHASDRSHITGDSSRSGAYFQSVARMGVQVADALACAHNQGVLHRDIKPSNLLLDTQGNVWVTDFGLAKQTLPAAASEGAPRGGDLTGTGDVVGTLRYMAPERFGGKSDAQGDIYGLGATLYEMLTLHPVFTVGDRARLIQQITHEEPSRPRKLDRQIPADLETIVLKAIEKDPASRYQRASDMADDLRRFLAYLPIRARRTPSLVRLGRWCRRNPALATVAAALVVSLAAGFAGVLWEWRRAEANLRETARQKRLTEASLGEAQRQRNLAERNLTEAMRQTDRARKSYELARKAVDDLVTATSDAPSIEPVSLQGMRIKLLQVALALHEGLTALAAEDPDDQRELAASYWRVAALQSSMDANAQAVDACQKAVELLQRLTREHPGEAKFEALLGTCLSSLGYYQHAVRRFDRAKESLDRAIAIWSGLVQHQPAEANYQNELARAYNNMGYLYSATGKPSEAIDYQERSLAIRENLARDHPENRVFRRSLAVSLSSLSRRNTEARRLEEAVALRERCLRVFEELRQEDPGSLKLHSDLASNFNALGDIYRVGRKPPDWYERGMGAYQQALEMQVRLAREHPANLRCKLELAGTYHDMALLCRAHGDDPLSLTLVEQEIAVREPILRPDPGAFYVKAAVLAELGRMDEAFAPLARAIELFRAAEQKAKGAISHRRELRDCHSLRARWHMSRGAYSEAILDWQWVRDVDPQNADATLALARIFSNGPRELRDPRKAVAYAREAAERRPRDWQSTVTLGAACYRAGDFPGAIAAFQRARPLNGNRESPFEWLFLAMSHQRLDEPEAAREALARAVDLMARGKPSHWLLPHELENLRAEAEELLNEG